MELETYGQSARRMYELQIQESMMRDLRNGHPVPFPFAVPTFIKDREEEPNKLLLLEDVK
jgi:hypothetical protein